MHGLAWFEKAAQSIVRVRLVHFETWDERDWNRRSSRTRGAKRRLSFSLPRGRRICTRELH